MDYSTIELTPDMIFERISPTSLRDSTRQNLAREKILRRSETPTQQQSDNILSKHNSLSREEGSIKRSNSAKKTENGSRPMYGSRKYHSLGTRPTNSPQYSGRDKRSGSSSSYGVAISVKGIQGQSFVILEDKENHRHVVPAPDPSESSDTSSNTSNEYPNRSIVESDGNYTPQALPRRQDISTAKRSYGPPIRGIPNERREKASDSEVSPRAPSLSPAIRSPDIVRENSLTPPEKQLDGVKRSRSLSPNGAVAATKRNRARSVSPPRNKNRMRGVDHKRTQPVMNLIGLFETAPEDRGLTSQSSTSVGSDASTIGRSSYSESTFPVTLHRNVPGMTNKLANIPTPWKKSDKDATRKNSNKPNFKVATATVSSSLGSGPMGRYFALTSPATSSPSHHPDFTASPRSSTNSAPLRVSEASSIGSSDVGLSTDEGTLHLEDEKVSIRKKKDSYRADDERSDFSSEYSKKKGKPADANLSLPTEVSSAKIYSPSQQLVRKAKRKRDAHHISTSNPGSRAVSGSEWSESEYSDGDSLGYSIHISDEDDDHHEGDLHTDSRSLPDHSSPVSYTGSTKRAPSIIFEKISSQDITKQQHFDQFDGSALSEPASSPTPSVTELQRHINELRKTVKALQNNTDDNLGNYVLLNDLRDKLQEAEKEKSNLEQKIKDGKETIEELERELEITDNEKQELQSSESHFRLVEQQQAVELEDLKSHLKDMKEELHRGKCSTELLESKEKQEAQLLEKLHRLESDYEALLSRQKELERKLQDQDATIASLRKALHAEEVEHEAEVKKMKKTHDNIQKELDTTREEKLKVFEDCCQLEHQLSSLRNEFDLWKNEHQLDSKSRRSSSSSSSDEEFDDSAIIKEREEASRTKHLLDEAQIKLQESQNISDQQQQEVKLLRAKLLRAEDDNNQLKDTLEKLEKLKNNADCEIDALKANIEEQSRALIDADTENNKLQDKLTRIEEKLDAETEEKDTSAADKTHAELALLKLKEEIAEMNRNQELKNVETVKLENMLSITEDDKLNLEEKLEEHEKQHNNMKNHLQSIREDLKDKDIEIEELKHRIKCAENSSPDESEKIADLEHQKYVAEMQVSGLKEALEAKHTEVEEAEDKQRKLLKALKESKEICEESLRKLKDAEKQKRLASKQAEDLTKALSEKVVLLDEAQRKLRRMETQVAEMKDETTSASSLRFEFDKAKRSHAQELFEAQQELKETKRALTNCQKSLEVLQEEIPTWEERYDAVSKEALALEQKRRNANHLASEAQKDAKERMIALAKAEEKLRRFQEKLEDSENQVDKLTKQLREMQREQREVERICEDLRIHLSDKERQLSEAEIKMLQIRDEMERSGGMREETKRIIFNLEESKREAREEMLETRNKLDDLQRRLDNEEEEVLRLQAKLDETENALKKQLNRSRDEEENKRRLQNALSASKKEFDDKRRSLRQAQVALNNIEQKMNRFETTHEQKTNPTRDVISAKLRAQREFKKLKREIKKKKEETSKIHRMMYDVEEDTSSSSSSDFENQDEVANKRLRELEEELKQNNLEMEKLCIEIRMLKSKIQQVSEEKERSEKSCDLLKQQLQTTQEEMKERSDYSGKMKEELEIKIKNLKSDMETLNEALTKSNKTKRKLEEKMSSLIPRDKEPDVGNEDSLYLEIHKLRNGSNGDETQFYNGDITSRPLAENAIAVATRVKLVLELNKPRETNISHLEQTDSRVLDNNEQIEEAKLNSKLKNEELKVDERDRLLEKVSVLSVELSKAMSDGDQMRAAQLEDQKKLENVEELLNDLKVQLKEEKRKNLDLQEQLSDYLRNVSQSSESEEEDAMLRDAIEKMSLKVKEAETEKENTASKMTALESEILQLRKELESERWKVETLESNNNQQMKEITKLRNDLDLESNERGKKEEESNLVATLKNKITELEEKVQQEADQLQAIVTRHQSTESKLRDVLKQAETETIKADNDKEAIILRMRSLKQQLSDAEEKLLLADEDRKMLEERLTQQANINNDLRRNLVAGTRITTSSDGEMLSSS